MPQPRPSPDELRAFLAGRIIGDDAQRIEAFLDSDPGALAELERSAGAAELRGSFESVSDKAMPENDPHLTKVIEKLKAGDFSPLNIAEQARRILDAAITDEAPGRLGKFEIIELIAAGGMGLVFKARDPVLQRDVAIKTLSARLAVDKMSRESFLREARAVALLDHPNILPIHAVEEGEHVPFIVMPLLGRTLRDLVAEDGPMEPRRAAVLIEQAARALAAAHDKGIVHRDIKPANLLLDEVGERVYVADFGIARHGEDGDGAARGSGTPAFAAPEQMAGGDATPKSDLYSLGATLHFALTGEPPVKNGRFSGAKWLGRLIADLRQPDPAERPDSAQMVAQRLRRGLRQRPRRRALAIGLVAAAGGAIVAAALSPLGLSGIANRALGWRNGEHFFVAGRLGTFDSLGTAANSAKGRAVVVDIDGEHAMSSFAFRQSHPLWIRAAPGRRPILVPIERANPMIQSEAPLTLEGMTLLRRPTEGGISPMVMTINAPMVLRRCAIVSLQDGTDASAPIAVLGWTSDLTIENSALYTGRSPWLIRRGAPVSPAKVGAEIKISNTLIIGRDAQIRGNPNLTIRVSLHRVTAVGEMLFTLYRNHPVEIYSKECVLIMEHMMVWTLALEVGQRQEDFLDWSAERNAYGEQPPSHGFLRWGRTAYTGQHDTPEKWRELPYARELDPSTLLLTEPSSTPRSLRVLQADLQTWEEANRKALEDAAPRGADVKSLLRNVLRVGAE